MTESHYPAFDVLAEQEEWDDFSRSVVLQRLQPPPPELLNEDEVATLRAVAANLLHESRSDVLDFVVSQMDKELAGSVGEADRKTGVPPQKTLVRQGLRLLDMLAESGSIPAPDDIPANGTAGHAPKSPDQSGGSTPFSRCTPGQQAWVLQQLQLGQLTAPPGAPAIGQKDLFKKLLGLSVAALASHPAVWSDMGYAGPAYPRGYYRIELGLTDPWEAQASNGMVDR